MMVPGFVWVVIQAIGAVIIVVGARRALTAPKVALERAAGAENPETYAKGYTDFLRISGALAVFVGLILALVPIFAR